MSSKINKLRTRIELDQENRWLRTAFSRAWKACEEQSNNAAELSRALWLAAEKNGGELRVGPTVPERAKLRAMKDDETGETVFLAHIDEAPDADAPVAPGIEQ